MTDTPDSSDDTSADGDIPVLVPFDSTVPDQIDQEADQLRPLEQRAEPPGRPPGPPDDDGHWTDQSPDDHRGDDDPYYGEPAPIPVIDVMDFNPHAAYLVCCEALLEFAHTIDGHPGLMVKDRRMLRVEDDTQLAVDGARLVRMVSQVVRCVMTGRRQQQRPLPRVVQEALEADPPSGLPTLRALVTHPVLAGDRLHSAAGYDNRSCIWVSADADVPADMTVEEAVHLIDEALIDVPFADGSVSDIRAGADVRGGDRAAAFAAILTPLIRYDSAARDGRLEVPLWLVDKAAPGTGATTLVRLASLISSGRPPVAQRMLPNDDDELRKSITSILLDASDGMVVFDNADRLVGDSLAKLLTDGGRWSDRRLGASENLSLTHNILWSATGNNPTIEQQLQRRTLPCRLHVSSERPDQREVQHGDPEGWVLDHLHDIRRAVASLVQRWIEAGQPRIAPSWGSYQGWADRIGGILHIAGVRGFGQNRTDLTDRSDDTSIRWATLMHALAERFGNDEWGPGQAIEVADEANILPPWSTNAPTEAGRKNAVSKALRKVADRVWTTEAGGSYRLNMTPNRKIGTQFRVIASDTGDAEQSVAKLDGDATLPPAGQTELIQESPDDSDF